MLASVIVIAVVVYLPAGHAAFATVPLTQPLAAAVVLLALIPFAGVEAGKALLRARAR